MPLIARLKTGGLWPPVFFVTVLVAIATLYWPSLNGPFVFDDYAPTNLPALGAYNGVRNLETLWLYLSQSHSGPTGRPVAMLSFLANASNWPADPFPFKLTNLFLHLLNGTLLYLLLSRLLALRIRGQEARWIALISATFWLIHPMFVSTVLYAVQRMAILPVTFSLLGLLAYSYGRSAGEKDNYNWMTVGVVAGTLLATLSKENGALLPLLILIVERIWITPNSPRPIRPIWLILFLVVPSLLLAGYLAAYFTPLVPDRYTNRPFTLAERLLTEGRVVVEYLHLLLLPKIAGGGLFNDGYTVSQSLFKPVSTLFSIAAIIGLWLSAFLLRRRFPLYSLAILFFLAGHLIESTVIPLELFFEHRNYLPALFLFLPIASGVVKLFNNYRMVSVIVLLYFLLSGFMSHQRIETWQSEERLLATWAEENPDSVRAQISAAMSLIKQHRPNDAYQLLGAASQRHPDAMALHLHLLNLECKYNLQTQNRLARLLELIDRKPFDFHDYNLMKNALDRIHNNRCEPIEPATVYTILDKLDQNLSFEKRPSSRRMLYHWRGQFLLSEGRANDAWQAFRASQSALPDIEAGLLQTALLAKQAEYRLAIRHLDLMEDLLHREAGTKAGLDFAVEIDALRRQILDDMNTHDPH